MSYVAFHNHEGRAVAWFAEMSYPAIFLFSGKPVAWMSNEAVYSYSGKYLGWFQDGWIRDRNGYAVFFIQGA